MNFLISWTHFNHESHKGFSSKTIYNLEEDWIAKRNSHMSK